jgi:hypothetical protein
MLAGGKETGESIKRFFALLESLKNSIFWALGVTS